MNATAKKSAAQQKTLAKQKARTAEAHPDVTLAGLDDAETEQTPSAPSTSDRHELPEDGGCGATRYQQGALRICELPLHHPGHHAQGERGWRRSSGDGAERAERPEDSAEDEPTA